MMDESIVRELMEMDKAFCYGAGSAATQLGKDWLEMKARIEKLEQELRWVPVAEGLPDPKDSVFFTNGTRVYIQSGERKYLCDLEGLINHTTTHWMPLPKPPE